MRCYGSTLTEFALTLPLLAILLFGIIQYGFIFNAYMTLRHGAHETARSLSLAGAQTNAAVALSIAQQAINPMLDISNLGTPTISVVTVTNSNKGINVGLSYGLPLFIRYVVPNAVGDTLTITASATYRLEKP